MNRNFKSFLWVLTLVALPFFMMGQRTISGTVTDLDSGDPLIGVNILIVGTSSGTATDFDGKFTMDIPEGKNILRFSYTGYASKEVELGEENEINIQLSVGEVLNEVVIIGYGTVKKEDATGSVAAVSTEDFNKGAITSPQELLAGKIPGVAVTTDGAPGGGSTIRIRGGSSLSAVNDPLIVIDGVPVATDNISGSRNPLNVINPNDIETFTVLKDASATAIYGSRASNGVILITTKKGALGRKISVGYNGNIAFSNVASTLDVFDADGYRAMVADRYEADHPIHSLIGTANTNWQEEIFQTGINHDHNLNFSGGIADIPYRVSLGITSKEGILLTDKFNRTTGSINLNPGFLDNTLQVNLSFKGMQINNHFADNGAIGNAVRFDPTQPTYSGSDAYGGYYTWLQNNGDPNTLAPTNPLALLNLRNDESTVNRYIINGSVDYRFSFLPELRANLNLGLDQVNSEGTVDIPEYAAFAFSNGGEDREYSQEKKNELLEFYLNYVKDLGNSTLDLMGGYSWQHFFVEDYVYATNVAGTEVIADKNTTPNEYYLLSLFGRANYSLMDKYLFTATIRSDGTSRFSPDNRWGLFPAAAFAWKIIDDSDKGALSNLKLRLGWGVTGQQAIDVGGDLAYYPYLARYLGSQSTAQYQLGDIFYSTLRPEGYDENIKWEETTTYNVGFDFGFINDRITGSLEYYYRVTDDLLNQISVPAGTNLTNFLLTNVGSLKNNGVEIAINAIPYKTEDAMWNFGMNVTFNKNEITKLTATDDPDYFGVETGGISGGVGNNIQIHRVGYPASSFLVYEQVYDENGTPIEGLYVDRNTDGEITPEDKYVSENPNANVLMGFTTAFNYKKFELSAAARASIGNYIYNNNLSSRTAYSSIYHSTNYTENVMSATTDINFDDPEYFSDHFIEDGSFFRVDHITLGYNFTNIFKGKNAVKLYATFQNPILMTKYSGIDPEIFGGIDNNIYPRSKTILFGVNANF